MAAQSSIGSSVPENGEPRDFNADVEKALKERISEYKRDGLDTEFLDERLRGLVNAKKGRRKSSEDAVDRADSTDGMVENLKEIARRENNEEPDQKERHGVPDQLPTPVAPEADVKSAADAEKSKKDPISQAADRVPAREGADEGAGVKSEAEAEKSKKDPISQAADRTPARAGEGAGKPASEAKKAAEEAIVSQQKPARGK